MKQCHDGVNLGAMKLGSICFYWVAENGVKFRTHAACGYVGRIVRLIQPSALHIAHSAGKLEFS